MATLITKNSSTASAVPASGDLVKGELAVNVTDKKLYTKDNGGSVVKVVGSLGNQEANAVAITGGAVNGTTIGATTPSTGAFTTASASSGFTGNLTGNVTGNVSGTAANVTGVVAIANGGTGLSALGTGVQTALGQNVTGSGSIVLATSPALTTPNLGTPSAAVLTNATGLPLTTGVTGTLGVANGGTGITAFGTGVATALGQNVTGSGGIVLATSPSLTTPNLGTPSAATLTNATGLPISTGVSGLGTGVATALAVNTGSAGAFVVNGGALGTPSSGTVTNLTGTASININGTVGATTPTTGAFTTVSASGNITVSGGTANGVAYLNGSKVLTTGSALTFDGTTLYTSAAVRGTGGFSFEGAAVGSATGPTLNGGYSTGGGTAYIQGYNWTTSAFIPLSLTGSDVRFTTSGSEQMRLTSTGLGIGTSSPSYKLDARLSGTSSGAVIQVGNTGSGGFGGLGVSDGGAYPVQMWGSALSFLTGSSVYGSATERMRLDSSGNLGLGVTPPSTATINTINLGRTASGIQAFASGSFFNTANAFWASSGWTYGSNGHAFAYGLNLSSNQHEWFTAASGTAGNAISFTQAMTLDASGRFMVGATTPTAGSNTYGVLSSLSATSTLYQIGIQYPSVATWGLAVTSGSAFTISQDGTERARIDSSGRFYVGATTDLTNGGFDVVPNYDDVGSTAIEIGHKSTAASGYVYASFLYNNTKIGSITQSGTTAVAYNTSSDYRLKEDIAPMTGALAKVAALKPVTYKWKADGSDGEGFIAHELAEVVPQCVTGEKDAVDAEGNPKYQGIDTSFLVATLTAALQEAHGLIKQLQADVAALKGQ